MPEDERSDGNLKGRTLLGTMTYFFVSFSLPSHNACVLHLFSLQALLNHKTTNVNIEGRNKYTPLHSAAHLEHRCALEICQKLVSITWITRLLLVKHAAPIDNLSVQLNNCGKRAWIKKIGFILNRMEQGSTHCGTKRFTELNT